MRVLVISSACVIRPYVEAITALFPDWEVRGIGYRQAAEWLANGSKPELSDYAGCCDLYFGLPITDNALGSALNSRADRIIVPEIRFKGFHPDITILPECCGPLTVPGGTPNAQFSLIIAAAKTLGRNVDETAALFSGAVYEALGYLALYDAERRRMISKFAESSVDLREEFGFWEAQGPFFYVPHHPMKFVLVDIVRRALAGRFLDGAALVASVSLRDSQKDFMDGSEVWPIYPVIAARHMLPGSTTWRLPAKCQPRDVDLGRFISMSFECLAGAAQGWRDLPAVQTAANHLKLVKI